MNTIYHLNIEFLVTNIKTILNIKQTLHKLVCLESFEPNEKSLGINLCEEYAIFIKRFIESYILHNINLCLNQIIELSSQKNYMMFLNKRVF